MKEKNGFKKCALALVLFACSMVAPRLAQAAGNTAFERQEASALLAQGKFSVSSQKVKMQVDERAGGIMIQGDVSDLSGAVFSFKDSFAFGKEQADCEAGLLFG